MPRSNRHVPAAPGGLGPVEREIGVAEQLVRRLAIVRIKRHADADIDADLALADRERRLAECQRDLFGTSSARGPATSSPPIDDGEFVAAQSRDETRAIDQRVQAARDGAEQLVAAGVAQRVVDLLELVEIEHQQRDLALLGCPPRRAWRRDARTACCGWRGRSACRARPDTDSLGLALALRNVAHHRAILQAFDALPYRKAGFERKRLAVLPASLKLHDLAARHLSASSGSSRIENGTHVPAPSPSAQTRSSGWPIISFGS